MPDGDRAPTERHATWVALRTFRQRPTVVGRTEQGETIYEIRSVPVLFPTGSAHFKRLVHCAKCRMEMAGSPLLSPDDLDRQPNPAFCGRCSRADSQAVKVAPPPPPPAPKRPQPAAPAPQKRPQPAVQEDGGRLAAVEGRLAEVMRRLNSQPAVEQQVAALAGTVAELQRELRQAATAPRGAESGTAAMLDAQRTEFSAALAGADRELRAEISALAQQMRDGSEEISRSIAAQRDQMEAALEDVVQRTLAAVAPPIEDIRARQQAIEDKFSASLASLRAETLAQMGEQGEERSTDDLGAAIEGRFAEVQATMAALAGALKDAQTQAARGALDAVSAPLRDLTRARQAIEDRLDALTASVDAGMSRQHVMEQKLQECMEQVRQLAEAPAEPGPGAPYREPGEILEGLERQLRAAEQRLAQR